MLLVVTKIKICQNDPRTGNWRFDRSGTESWQHWLDELQRLLQRRSLLAGNGRRGKRGAESLQQLLVAPWTTSTGVLVEIGRWS